MSRSQPSAIGAAVPVSAVICPVVGARTQLAGKGQCPGTVALIERDRCVEQAGRDRLV